MGKSILSRPLIMPYLENKLRLSSAFTFAKEICLCFFRTFLTYGQTVYTVKPEHALAYGFELRAVGTYSFRRDKVASTFMLHKRKQHRIWTSNRLHA
jgi:hypothetical protein